MDWLRGDYRWRWGGVYWLGGVVVGLVIDGGNWWRWYVRKKWEKIV